MTSQPKDQTKRLDSWSFYSCLEDEFQIYWLVTTNWTSISAGRNPLHAIVLTIVVVIADNWLCCVFVCVFIYIHIYKYI